MALSDRLAILVTANGTQAIREFKKVGTAAATNLGKAETSAQRWSRTLTRAGAVMVTVGAVAAVGLFKLGQAAAEQAEAQNRVNVVFGESASVVNDFAKSSASSFAVSEGAALDAAGGFGLFFRNAGIAADEAANMSVEMVALAGDMASFRDVPVSEALEALRAALAGQIRPMRRFGADLTVLKVKEQAVTDGLIEEGQALTGATRQRAIFNRIMSQTSFIQGDMARTGDSAVNQQRKLTAELSDLASTLGAGVVPVMRQVVGLLRGFVGGVETVDRLTGGMTSKIAAWGSVLLITGGAISLVAGQLLKLRRLSGVFDRLAVGAFGAAGHMRALSIAGAGVGVAVAGVMIAAQHFARQAQEAQERTDKWTEALEGLREGEESTFNQIVADTISTDKYLSKFREAGLTIEQVTEALTDNGTEVEQLQARHDELTASLGSLTVAEQQELSSLEGIIHAVNEERVSLDNAETAITDNEAALQAMGLAVDDTTERLNELLDATLAVFNAEFRHVDASNQLAEALAKVEALAASGSVGTLEYAGAVETARREAIGMAEASLMVAEEMAEQAGATLTADQRNRVLIDSLAATARTLAPGSPLRNELEAFIGRLLGIPTDRETTLQAFADLSQAENAVAAWLRVRRSFNVFGVSVGLGRRQHGGPVTRGQPFLVGEAAPEVFIPNQSGRVEPLSRVRGGGDGGGGSNITINMPPGADGQDVVDALERWERRNGRRFARA